MFIDSINGESNIKVNELLSYSNEQLFEEFINKEEVFNSNIYKSFMKLKYNFKNKSNTIDINQYYNILSDCLYKNESIKKDIQYCILKATSKENKFINTVFYNELAKFEKNGIDFLNILKNYTSSIIESLLSKFIYISEKEGVLCSMLFRANKDKEIIWKEYLNDIDFKEIAFEDRTEGNVVDKILDLKVPYSIVTWKNVIKYIQEIKDEYLGIENELRQNLDEEEKITIEKKHANIIPRKETNVLYEIEKQQLFKTIDKIENNNELYKEMFYDYLYVYLSEKHNTFLDPLIQLVELILEIKYNTKEQYDKQTIAKYILWLESYSESIHSICSIFETLSLYVKNLIDIISERAKSTKLKGRFEINKPFYNMIESLLISLFIEETVFDFDDINKVYDLNNELNNVLNISMMIDSNLKLISREIFALQSFLMLFKLIMKTGDKANELIKDFFALAKKEAYDRIMDINAEIKNDFNAQYEFCEKNLKDIKEYPETMMSMILLKYKQNKDDEFREKLFTIALSNNKFIINSKELIFYYFLRFDLCPFFPDLSEEVDNKEEIGNCIELFLEFAKEEDQILSILDKADNIVLDEIILFCFESSIISFFEKVDEYYFNGVPLDYFKICTEYIKNYYFKKVDDEYIYQHLGLLYSIAYIKLYLYFYVEFYQTKNTNFQINFKPLNEIIEKDLESTGKTIQLYTLKLFRKYFNSYEEFKNYHWEEHQMKWTIDNFSFDEKVKSSFEFLFLNLGQNEMYTKINNIFEGLSFNKFNDNNKEFNALINDNKKIFIDVIINKILSNLHNKYYIEEPEFCHFSNWLIHSLIIQKDLQFSSECKSLLSLFDNVKIIKSKIFENKEEISISVLEILLYSFKITFNATESNGFFSHFFSPKIKTVINDNYIPGTEPNNDIRIYSYFAIEESINSNESRFGVYICPCGSYYEVPPCGYPTEVQKCRHCNGQIGGINHDMLEIPNHFRIAKDEKHRKEIMRYYKSNIKLLSELKKEVNEIIEKEEKGIKAITRGEYKEPKRYVRGVSQITYRFLSFVQYSILFYAKAVGFLSQDDMKKFISDNSSFIDILQDDWKIMKSLLNDRQVHHIQIFMNLVLEKIYDIIKECPMLTTKELRKEFENKINIIVEEVITEYQAKSNEYIEQNNKLLQLDIYSLKNILHELIDPSLYSNESLPFIKYFMLTTYSSVKSLEEELDSNESLKEKYPVLYYYLKQIDDNNKLRNLNLINPFVNYMMNKYSYKITRDEAKNLSIETELTTENEKKLFAQFQEGFNNVSSIAVKYACKPEMPEISISASDSIAYCLNDDGDYGYGMYLAALYEKFIGYQNTFLRNVTNTNEMKEITIQDATKSDIVSFEINSDRCLYDSIKEMLCVYSKRNCFNEDYSINYAKYQKVSYDFEKLNEELKKIFLPGTKKFKTEQKFVTFKFEFLHGARSSLLQNFADKYKQRKLSLKEKEIVYNYKNKVKQSTDFLFNLQIIIFYLQKENYLTTTPINDVINSLPEYITINNECKSIFITNQSFLIEILLGIYEYFEYLCFEKIKENVNDEYKKTISDFEKDKINGYFNVNKEKIITKVMLSSATRKFVSRYLSGLRSDEPFKKNENIMYMLMSKEDLWDKDIFNNDKFNTEMEEMIDMNIKVEQAVELWNVLGDDREIFGEDVIKNVKKNEEEEGNKKENNKKKRDIHKKKRILP